MAALTAILFGYLTLRLVFVALAAPTLAQDGAYLDALLTGLDVLGLTSFTSVVRQVDSDPSQPIFSLSLSDFTIPYTLFVPDNDAFSNGSVNVDENMYHTNDTAFLSSLLQYHLAPGTWREEDLRSDMNHTIITTTLQGSHTASLESGSPQVIACGVGPRGIEIYNQRQPTVVLATYLHDNFTVHVLNAVMAIPASYSTAMKTIGLTQIDALRIIAGGPDLDDASGFTLFAPTDDAFVSASAEVSTLSPRSVFDDHIILGRTVYSSAFRNQTYTSSSGLEYSFSHSGAGSTVALNGTTATIIRSDYLTNNGVIHTIDKVLFNASPAPIALSPSAASGLPPRATSDPSSSSEDAYMLTPAVVITVMCVGIFALCLPLVIMYIKRRRRTRRLRPFSKRHSGLPTVTPFYARDVLAEGTANLTHTDDMHMKSSPSTSRFRMLDGSRRHTKVLREQVRHLRSKERDIPSVIDISRAQPDGPHSGRLSPPSQEVPMPSFSQEADHTIEEVTKTIDPPQPTLTSISHEKCDHAQAYQMAPRLDWTPRQTSALTLSYN